MVTVPTVAVTARLDADAAGCIGDFSMTFS
jgi:hypothetical protein